MKKILAAVMLLLTMAGAVFALTDREYLYLKDKSAEFRRADRRLTQIWKELKAEMSKRAFKELQEDQREWLKSGRDDAADYYMDEGCKSPDAYAKATNDRADILRDLAQRIERLYR